MIHHLWYFKVKLKHAPKQQCSEFITLDSFEMFRNKEGVEWCRNKVILEIPRYKLKAFLLDNCYLVECKAGSYSIPHEKQACNYGGFRYFFRCPECNKRMRILYCNEGVFLCRKCLNLGYFTQVLTPAQRCIAMAKKIERRIKNRAGTLDRKPPWLKNKTFIALKAKYWNYYEIKYRETKQAEIWQYCRDKLGL